MAIPKPDPKDWARQNAQELLATDREVLAMLRDAYRRVNVELAALGQAKDIRRAQLEATRAKLLAEQAGIFERLGDITAARRARSASRAQRLSAASDAALLALIGKGAEAEYLYESAKETSQRAIDVAIARMRLGSAPLSERIYRTSIWMQGRLGKLINEQLAIGINAREFAKAARDWFNPGTPGGVRFAAMRLARTEINNTFHAMTAAKAADTPWVDDVEWHLSLSHPKKDECNPLAEYNGGIYPSDAVPPRPHPQCMCYITPKPIGEDDFVENFLKGDYDDYLDAELKAKGWDEPEPKAASKPKDAPGKLPKTQEAAMQKFRPGMSRNDWAAAGANLNAIDALVYKGLVTQSGTKTQYAQGGSYQAPTYDFATRSGSAAHEIVPKGLFKRGTMTSVQRKALQEYESGWFAVIQFFLRFPKTVEDPEDASTRKTIEAIDSAMQESILPEQISAFRGMYRSRKLFGDRLDGDLTGFEWEERGYSSITTEEGIVDQFNLPDAEYGPEEARQNIKMKIVVESGVGALETSTSTKGSKESGPQAEITLQRDLSWRIIKDNGYDAAGIRHLDVAVGPVREQAQRPGTDAGATGR